MDTSIIEKLSALSEEEKKILAGQAFIYKTDYASSSDFIVSGLKLMGSNKKIDLRLHTRFIDFPLHGHDYMEIMYVYSGTITHIINDKKILLKSGDIIFFNKHIQHSIEKAEMKDIGVNFVVTDNFLKYILHNIENNKLMSDFVLENFNSNGLPEYLQFNTNDIFPIRNLLDNLIYAIANHTLGDDNIPIQLVSLLFTYLSFYKSSLANAYRSASATDIKKQNIMEYIQKRYFDASLVELAKSLSYSPEYLSRWIKQNYGYTFKELILKERLNLARKLIITTKMSIAQIISSIGYENQSYFYKIFRQRFGKTPYQYRIGNTPK